MIYASSKLPKEEIIIKEVANKDSEKINKTAPKKVLLVEDILNSLSYCESRNRDNFRILDTNGKYSYSCFQFQEATFHRYGNLYNLPHENIYSCKEQREIARKMIEDKLYSHWKNCMKKIGVL